MLTKPHRKFCDAIVSGCTGVRAYAQAYPHCSLKTARINASHLRAKPPIQQEIARLRAQADAIAGPAVLKLIEKRLWLARVVRANLARLDPEIDGDLLVSLDIGEDRKKPRVRKIRIVNKLSALKLDCQLAGNEAAQDAAEDSIAALIERVTKDQPYIKDPPTTAPPASDPAAPPPSSPIASHESPNTNLPSTPASPQRSGSSNRSADSPSSDGSQPAANHPAPTSSESSADSTFDPRPSSFDPPASSFDPSAPSPFTPPPSPHDFMRSRPRFDPGPEAAARLRRPPIRRRHLWEEC